MTRTASKTRFKAKLFRPAEAEKADSWMFHILPKEASAKLPSRGITPIEGTINGFPFQAALGPDGQKSHWLKVDRKLRKSVGADAGNIVTLEIAPAGNDTEPEVPPDLRKHSPPPRRKRARYGRTSRPTRAEIGSTGSPPPNRKRRARAESKMPARCSRPGSDGCAASTGPGSTAKA
jgi:Domain of unknown function (DUF1905)